MDSTNYKHYHEARMINNTGSSPIDIEAVLTTVSIGVFLRLLLHFQLLSLSRHLNFWVDFIFIVLPVILEVTAFSGQVFFLPMMMCVTSVTIICTCTNTSNIKKILSKRINNQKSYLSNYRAGTNLVSSLCILAVDFTIFPRNFAKTETFGFGLMDLGVGYFICSNGIVTKNLITRLEFSKMIKSSSILFTLGLIRLLSVKSTDYHEHTSEYGVHWNFFFTLGFCRIISYSVLMLSPVKKPFVLAVLFGIIHQGLLYSGLQQWAFSNLERDTLLTANREGLISLLGYVSLYFASVAIGETINRPESKTTYKQLIITLSGFCVCAWVFTGICHSTLGISRRLANVGYISWILSSTISVMIEFALIDVVISSINQSRGKLLNISQTPFLLCSINANGLFFFLLANLMTGLINLCFQTFLFDTFSSIFLITIYMLIICAVSSILYNKNWTFKFW